MVGNALNFPPWITLDIGSQSLKVKSLAVTVDLNKVAEFGYLFYYSLLSVISQSIASFSSRN